jgi:hypothetical protein
MWWSGWHSGNAVDWCSRGARFESGPEHLLSWIRSSSFSLVPPGNFRDSTSVKPRPLHSISFPIHHLSVILSWFGRMTIDGVWNGYWIYWPLYIPLVLTRNYSVTANLHTLQIIRAPVKPFPACYFLTSRSLATASNSGDSSASRPQVLLAQPSVQNSSQLNYSAISSRPPLQSSTALPTLNSLAII